MGCCSSLLRRFVVHYRALLCCLIALLGSAFCFGPGAAYAQDSRLDTILKRDKLIVAVSNSSVPVGFIDENGTHTGFEIEFARLMAKAILGSPDKIELVVVTSDGRLLPSIGRTSFRNSRSISETDARSRRSLK